MMGKDLWLFGTFKNRLTRRGTIDLLNDLDSTFIDYKDTQLHIGVCPTFTALADAAIVASKANILVAAQDCVWDDSISFTGGTSCSTLTELACTHVILGHSERRIYLGETNDMIAKKLNSSLAHGLVPIICIGEFYDDLEAGRTEEVIRDQIQAFADVLPAVTPSDLILAYEPAWAISTSEQHLTCSPADAKIRHEIVRKIVADYTSRKYADNIRVIYGGSVDYVNAPAYLTQPGIDGALVGTASQSATSFRALIKSAASVSLASNDS